MYIRTAGKNSAPGLGLAVNNRPKSEQLAVYLLKCEVPITEWKKLHHQLHLVGIERRFRNVPM